ncbi:2836_t:CDS:2 [Cetraspora pellucida]|uniref:2836_t:CDS:1 n=1 Tax=Cetraspora pellucida TaxID=1433469 RepID=A0ACA9KK62_9GLOM|nr:2836_t:CDS:2 [Cetraspora pellucida]
MELQEIINEKFRNNKISDKQILQALEFVLKVHPPLLSEKNVLQMLLKLV